MSLDSIFDKCRRICRDPDFEAALRWKEEHPGAKVVGCFPVYTPAEIIHARWMLPLGVMGAGNLIEMDQADSRIQSFIYSIAVRSIGLLRRAGIEDEVTFTGGVALNAGMIDALEKRLGVTLNVSPDAEFNGALGAAILCGWRLQKLSR